MTLEDLIRRLERYPRDQRAEQTLSWPFGHPDRPGEIVFEISNGGWNISLQLAIVRNALHPKMAYHSAEGLSYQAHLFTPIWVTKLPSLAHEPERLTPELLISIIGERKEE